MSTLSEATGLFRDLLQVLILDRLNTQRRLASKQAGAHCRTVRFHSRSKIKPLPWRELNQLLGISCDNTVSVPNPATELGDVGGADYYCALAALTKSLQPKSIFEFGTYLGVSALTMAANSNPDCQIYTMDLPDAALVQGDHELNHTDQNLVSRSRNRVGQAFLDSPFRDRIVQIRGDSMTYRAEKNYANVDLVFVDGGHSTPLITKDTENAFRIISNHGTILWDDYFHAYPDVVAYLDMLAEHHPLHSIPGTNFVIYSRRWDKSAI